jgi:hypothetical protein
MTPGSPRESGGREIESRLRQFVAKLWVTAGFNLYSRAGGRVVEGRDAVLGLVVRVLAHLDVVEEIHDRLRAIPGVWGLTIVHLTVLLNLRLS